MSHASTFTVGLSRSLLVALGASACEPHGTTLVEHPDGSFSFEFAPDALLETEEGKVLWRGEHVRAAAQSFERRPSHGDVNAISVAEALQQRYAYEQIDGELSIAECRFASETAACVEGTIRADGATVLRRGVIMERSGRFFLLEILASERHEAALARARTKLEETLTWHR